MFAGFKITPHNVFLCGETLYLSKLLDEHCSDFIHFLFVLPSKLSHCYGSIMVCKLNQMLNALNALRYNSSTFSLMVIGFNCRKLHLVGRVQSQKEA